jgi:hypothetical protein
MERFGRPLTLKRGRSAMFASESVVVLAVLVAGTKG